MIFICTCSQDTTTDLLLPSLGDLPTFRFNIDRTEDYTWMFCRHGFAIKDIRSQSVINSRTLSSFYLRKPIYFKGLDIPKEGSLADWCRKETDELFKDLYREYEARNQTALIHSRNTQYGKLRQMRAAESYFKVANWYFFHGALPAELGQVAIAKPVHSGRASLPECTVLVGSCVPRDRKGRGFATSSQGRWVAKSLTGTPIGKGKSFFVKEVDPTQLDLSYPWFLQEKIDGEDEVTVVYVNGRLFAYRYPRTAVEKTDDVRLASLEDPSKWKPCTLTAAEQAAIRGFMSETGYSFGRFDFIRKDGELWFLELNPNGQWAWLDEKNEHGLISAIAEAIMSEDRRHQRVANARRSSLLARL